jgi:hypothetical protein
MGKKEKLKREAFSIVAGALSIFFLAVELIGCLILLKKGNFPIGWLDAIIIVFFSYVINKTLLNKENLSVSEIVFFVLLSVFVLALMFVGFIIGALSVL